MNGRIFWYCKNPANRPAAYLAENQFREFIDLGIVFQNPVVTCEPAIEKPVLHITGHFLCADERAMDARIVDPRIVAARGK